MTHPVAADVLRSYYRAPEPHLRQWPDVAAVLRRFRPVRPNPMVLDLGSGSGQYSRLLGECLGGTVVALDPHTDMLALARQERPHDGVEYVGARAERLPLRSGVVDLVWASTSLHHVSDLPVAMAEILRVLRPDGMFVYRGALADRLDEMALYRYIPSARQVDERRLPRLERLVDLAAPRLRLLYETQLDQSVAGSLADYHRLLSTRPFSVLHHLSDEVWEGEFAAMGERSRRAGDAEIRERISLVVLGPGRQDTSAA